MTKKATKVPSKRVAKKDAQLPHDNRFAKPAKQAPLLAQNRVKGSKKRG